MFFLEQSSELNKNLIFKKAICEQFGTDFQSCLSPMCAKNCHIPDKILSCLNIALPEKNLLLKQSAAPTRYVSRVVK